MKKEDLIQELKNDQEDAYTIFQKGYLHHFDYDEDIHKALLPKLIKESNDLAYINQALVNTPDLVSDDIVFKFKQESICFYNLVNDLCLPELMDIPYISECRRVLLTLGYNNIFNKIENYEEQGFVYIEGIDGSLCIYDKQGVEVKKFSFTPMNKILKVFGINIEDDLYNLFYFGLFPKEEIPDYRKAYCFKQTFGF